LILCILLFSLSISGCNNKEDGSSIDNPPEFIEMYLDDEYAIETDDETVSLEFQKLSFAKLEDTDEADETDETDDEAEPVTPEYGGDIYSENTFEVIVITNGANYDLLYSVEVTDSLLGTCVYTNQSTLYVATSTIIVEDDQSYTTHIVLTIPGSTEHDTYLSERTISITKILFSRDTVDGTFPADIPENSTTALYFQIHALNYLDTELGLPLSVDGDHVNIILDPDSSFYDDAETLAKTTLIIPEKINDYDVGKIFLKDLHWVTEIQINGGNQDIWILGDFSNLTSLIIDGPEYDSILGYKNLTINGDFQTLESIEVDNLMHYALYLSFNNDTDDQSYVDYEDAAETLYSFPLLESINISNSYIRYLKIGADYLDIPFPSLSSIDIDQTVIQSTFFCGYENNTFPLLEELSITDSDISGLEISGTKPPTELPATLSISHSTISFTLRVSGSLISSIAIDNSILGDIDIKDGQVNDSVFSNLSFDTSTFDEDLGYLSIKGNHPNLSNLDINGITLNQILIGDVESVFSNLTNLTLSNISAYKIVIGERDVDLSSLSHLSLSNVDCESFISISGENADFSNLQDMTFTNVSASSLLIGNRGEDFSGLKTIICTHLIIDEDLSIYSGSDFTSLEDVVLEDVASNIISISPLYATYHTYFNDCDFNALYLNSGCQTIYVVEADVTTWPFYTYATENSILIETGIYTPSE
jgi:hypothetical protein